MRNGSSLPLTVSTGTVAHCVYKYSRSLCLQVHPLTMSTGTAAHCVYRHSRSLCLQVQLLTVQLLTVSTGTAPHCVCRYSRSLCLQVQSLSMSAGTAAHLVYWYNRSLCVYEHSRSGCRYRFLLYLHVLFKPHTVCRYSQLTQFTGTASSLCPQVQLAHNAHMYSRSLCLRCL